MDQNIAGIQDAIVLATEGMTAEEFGCRPQENKWSAAEVLEHLMLTYSGTAKGMEMCLAEGKPRVTGQSLKQRLLIYLIARRGFFPQGREAPKHVRPRGTPVPEVLPGIYHHLQAMDSAITRAEAQFGSGKILDHPLLGALTADEWRHFHVTHTRHHLKQIAAIRGRDCCS